VPPVVTMVSTVTTLISTLSIVTVVTNSFHRYRTSVKSKKQSCPCVCDKGVSVNGGIAPPILDLSITWKLCR
jgi:hypothetical protein